MIAQQLPNNIEIEKAILGCIIIEPEIRHYIQHISEEHFYNDTNRTLFKILSWMIQKEKTIDLITVSDYAAKKDIGIDYITQITDNFMPSSFHAYLEKLNEYRDRRYYIHAANRIIDESYNAEFTNRCELKNSVLSKISINVETHNENQFQIENVLIESFEEIERIYNNDKMTKSMYGFSDLDLTTAGVHKGEMTILAARPSVGKTSFAIQLLLNLAKKGNRCVFFTKEMPKRAIVQRMITNVAGIDSNRMRVAKGLKDDDWKAIAEATSKIKEMDIIVNDKCTYIEEIESFCLEQHAKKPIDIIFIDYVGLFSTMKKFENRNREVSIVSNKVKTMTINMDSSIFLLSQLSRDNVKNNRAPVLSDLLDSGSLEQDADNVFFLHRIDDDYGERKEIDDIDLIIEKQRNGPCRTIPFKASRNNYKWFGVR